jgi:predicted transcriptional regulator
MKNRSSTEIINTVLESIGPGSSKTRIMYQSYLSFTQLKDYLALLQDRDLVRYDESARLFFVTENGLRFMELFDELRKLVPNADERNERTELI